MSEYSVKELEKMRKFLCEHNNHKCLTNPNGKCPMSKYYCYDFPTLQALFSQGLNGRGKEEFVNLLSSTVMSIGYELKD